MNKIFSDQRGFALFNTVILTLITSVTAMILLNALPRVKNPQATLKLTARYVAEEQFACLESMAAAGDLNASNYSFQGDDEDLTTTNAGEGAPVKFTVDTEISSAGGNVRNVKVTVSWTLDGEDFKLESERRMRVVPK